MPWCHAPVFKLHPVRLPVEPPLLTICPGLLHPPVSACV